MKYIISIATLIFLAIYANLNPTPQKEGVVMGHETPITKEKTQEPIQEKTTEKEQATEIVVKIEEEKKPTPIEEMVKKVETEIEV